jgi:hypothetical protein
MKNLRSIMLFLILLPATIFGQSNYFSKDSVLSLGIKIIKGSDKDNSRFCRVKIGDQIIEYSPYEVQEYGFRDGRVYISKEINLEDSVKKVFLERLYSGKTSLFYYRGTGIHTFFLGKDSSQLLEIPRRNGNGLNYLKQLKDLISDCSNVTDAVRFVSYNKGSLTKLISRYNNCELKPFPHFRYGLAIGYEPVKLKPPTAIINNYIRYFNFRYDGGFMIGLFLDSPIVVSDFSLHTEVYFSRHGYSYNKMVANKDFDFIANISSLKLPVLIRYTYPSNKTRPFFNLGGIVNFNIKNESSIYETTKTVSIIEINDTQNGPLTDVFQAGFSIGSGVEYCLNLRNSLFLEFRYDKLYGDPNTLSKSILNLITGINF